MHEQKVFIGTYTSKLPFVVGKAEGIYVCSLNMDSGKLTYLSHTKGPPNPSYLAIEPQKRYIFSVEETVEEENPQIHALRINGNRLNFINSIPAGGGLPCHINVDQSGQYVFCANYETGSVACFSIESNGSIKERISLIQHHGSGSKHPRQLGPHAHAAVLNSDNLLLFVPDLGLDKILIYNFDPATGNLTPHVPPYAKTHPGAGPRHLVFHPSQDYAFLLNEMDATIIVYEFLSGYFNPIQTISTLPNDCSSAPSCAEIAVTPNGRFVYASNRGHNSLARFFFQSGQLLALGYTPTMGDTPRDFSIDNTGTFLLVGNQDSHTVVTYRINYKNGNLEETGHIIEIPNPVCILPVIL